MINAASDEHRPDIAGWSWPTSRNHLLVMGASDEIASRSRAIALQSVYAGIGLSVIGMIAAAFGYITPVQGALFQELIDVAVVLNALRALTGRIRGGGGGMGGMGGMDY